MMRNAAVIRQKNSHASLRNRGTSFVDSNGTSTGKSVALNKTKASCGSADDAKKASLLKLMPILKTMYHVERTARPALQAASAARLIPCLNKDELCQARG